jgi:uncharacterized protein (TIGR00725 family)
MVTHPPAGVAQGAPAETAAGIAQGAAAETASLVAGAPATARRRYTVTLYGSGEGAPEAWEFAEELGRRIAQHGWLLKNGGYGGTMAAAARGARSAGGRVVGVTCTAFGRSGPNTYLSEALETRDLFARLAALIEGSDAFGAFQGGTGTLTEVFLTWELMVKGLLAARPLCLLGPEWDPWWRFVEGDPALRRRMDLLTRATGADEAVRILGAAPA